MKGLGKNSYPHFQKKSALQKKADFHHLLINFKKNYFFSIAFMNT